MPANAQWLKTYYGKDLDFLNPEVIKEGKKWAVVKLTRQATKGVSSIGYVLIKKTGSHTASNYFSLHEGVPTKDDLALMDKKLATEDAK